MAEVKREEIEGVITKKIPPDYSGFTFAIRDDDGRLFSVRFSGSHGEAIDVIYHSLREGMRIKFTAHSGGYRKADFECFAISVVKPASE